MSEKKHTGKIFLAALTPPAELTEKWSSDQVDLVMADQQLVELKSEHDETFCCWSDDPCVDHQ